MRIWWTRNPSLKRFTCKFGCCFLSLSLFLNHGCNLSSCFFSPLFLLAPSRDAPALSTDQEVLSFQHYQQQHQDHQHERWPDSEQDAADQPEWDDEALAKRLHLPPHAGTASSASALTTTATTTAAELGTFHHGGGGGGDYTASSSNNNNDNIAERLRVEETKAQLAAAREGMERQAASLRLEQETKKAAAASGGGVAGSGGIRGGRGGGTGAGGGIWLPPHLRNTGGITSSGGIGSSTTMGSLRSRMTHQKLDVADNELFPDLASAEKILEASKPKKGVGKLAPKKSFTAPGGATWANKTSVEAAPETKETANVAKQSSPENTVESTKDGEDGVVLAEETKELNLVVNEENVAAVVAPEVSAHEGALAVKKALTKKKKKDLSTFKSAS